MKSTLRSRKKRPLPDHDDTWLMEGEIRFLLQAA
jgi:hypothetical protein